jgi:hypothetical protein
MSQVQCQQDLLLSKEIIFLKITMQLFKSSSFKLPLQPPPRFVSARPSLRPLPPPGLPPARRGRTDGQTRVRTACRSLPASRPSLPLILTDLTLITIPSFYTPPAFLPLPRVVAPRILAESLQNVSGARSPRALDWNLIIIYRGDF